MIAGGLPGASLPTQATVSFLNMKQVPPFGFDRVAGDPAGFTPRYRWSSFPAQRRTRGHYPHVDENHPFQCKMTQAAPARRAQRAPNHRGLGDEVPRGGWAGTRRSRVGGAGGRSPPLGVKGQSPLSRAKVNSKARLALREPCPRDAPVAHRAPLNQANPSMRANPSKAPKTKNRKMGFERAERPFAGCRALCSCGSPVGTSPKAKATSNVG